MRVDLARLNHVLIPESREARDRFRRSAAGRALGPLARGLGSLTRLGQAAALATLVVAAFGLDVRGTDVHVLFCVLVGALAGSLAVRRSFALDDVEVEVVLPPRVTAGEIASFVVVCKNRGPSARQGIQVSGPFLPWHARWERAPEGSSSIARVEPGGEGRAELRARFTRRGEHHLDPFDLAARLPLGLCFGPQRETAGVTVRVVPRPAAFARLAMPASRRHPPGRTAVAASAGDAPDLLGVRPYRAGDPPRDLHAKTWARSGEPAVREHGQERSERLGVLLDATTGDERRLEAAVRIAAGVVQHLSRGDRRVDLIVAGETVHAVEIGQGVGPFERALDLLACVRPAAKALSAGVARRVGPRLAPLSAAVVITAAEEGAARALVEELERAGLPCVRIEVDEATVREVEAGARLSR